MDFSKITCKDLIDNEQIITMFQPIFCAKRKNILAVEALSRGYLPETDTIIPPNVIFYKAEKEGLLLELDRLCRRKSVEAFKKIAEFDNDILLFINFDASVVDENNLGSNNFLSLIEKNSIAPNRILIEIIESAVKDRNILQTFVSNYRNKGFLIGIDDVGAGHSNLDRISLIKPDILKIDREIIKNIQEEYYKQEVLKSIANLSKNIGSLVVAEGIETESEAVISLEVGTDLYQGFYFAEPLPVDDILNCSEGIEKINSLCVSFKDHYIEVINKKRKLSKQYELIAKKIISCLSDIQSDLFDRCLSEIISEHSIVEYAYVINKEGIQVSSTIGNNNLSMIPKSRLFHPDKKGADQSSKDYYIFIKAGLKKFITESYISFASGRKSVTASVLFSNKEDEFILCLDLVEPFDIISF